MKIKLLKLEAEGAEPEIVQGIGEKLDLIEYISADLGFERNRESTFAPVTNYLLERNFEVINIYPSRVSNFLEIRNTPNIFQKTIHNFYLDLEII